MTIEGSNLGLKEEDVRGKIHIGDTPCSLVEYEVSVKIVCQTGPSQSEKVASVIIGNQAGFTESSVHFTYKVQYHFLVRLKIHMCLAGKKTLALSYLLLSTEAMVLLMQFITK